ncbi:hypothetical protein LCGC14_0988000 [marine sediment metagenome]|uniref:Uncharacterized protein n=1 Tax=marine sediment metagenome TaxID=412755 RepID=A0A0F9NT92_9ZZZZ
MNLNEKDPAIAEPLSFNSRDSLAATDSNIRS